MSREASSSQENGPAYNYFFKQNLLENKVALVTGGGSGIGLSICTTLVRHGCRVCLFGRNEERARAAAKAINAIADANVCMGLAADVRKPEQVEKVVEATISQFGSIDILINSAAGNFLAPASTISYNGFKTVMEIDALGTFNTIKAVYSKAFSQKTTGQIKRELSIVNITSTLSYRGRVFQAHAGSAKAAIEALTRHLAVEWGPEGVRVNCVAPGPIADTEGMSRLKGAATYEQVASSVPLGRLGLKQEVADAVLFLASPASSYITGTTLIIDGGQWLSGSNSMAESAKLFSNL